MVGPKQFKRVSWAPGVNMCQVRLFLSEDAPSQSALGSQDHLQAKAAWLLHSSSAAPDDSVPPGFEALPRGQVQRNIPSIKWQCPPIQWMKPEWLVVAGEESQEVASQNRRQLAVLEAVYPRSSSIPPDPSVSLEVQLAPVNDSQAPLIPIIAKEDEDAPEQDLPAQTAASSCPIPVVIPSTIPNLPRASVEPDIAAAASAAFTAIMRSNEEGSLIDRDLLIKLLCDPSMLEKLASEHAIPKQGQLPAQPPPTVAHPEPIFAPIPAPNLDSPPLCSPRVTIPRATAVPVNPLPAKDANYYKSLIQKHGGDWHEMTEPAPPYETSHEYHSNPLGSIYREGGRHEQKQNESRKPRTGKPCAYFNTPRGCRQGASCSYLHDSSPSTNSYLQTSSKNIMQGQQGGAKRIKFDR
ncbi:Zinc finger CCCH domain-containing protein 6 [Platanthera zijinensis]|uniref:Zinc finger CCCH domain-containing protein 6 n=1 Tax=Platanthera zijinensis TaxID=2320716 RepID=A0AAP0FUB3_9ASPA